MKLRNILVGFAIMSFGIACAGVALPQSVSARVAPEPPSGSANPSASCNSTLLTFPAWYKGLTGPAPDCEFTPPKAKGGGIDIKATILKIGLNVIEDILQLVGYVTVVMLIIGGFNYMTSQGDSNKMSSAKNTITNALIGLVISIMSVAIVNLVAGSI